MKTLLLSISFLGLIAPSSIVYAECMDMTGYKCYPYGDYSRAPNGDCLETICEYGCVESDDTFVGRCCDAPQAGSDCRADKYTDGCLIERKKICVSGQFCNSEGVCVPCPTSDAIPTGQCYDTIDHPEENGCPAYTTYTTKVCICDPGYTATPCTSGQMETARQTLADDTVCYQCVPCPTNETIPLNACYNTVRNPAANGCPAYTTYTIKPCTCAYGYSTTPCASGQTETARQTLIDGTVCYQCRTCPTSGTAPEYACYDTVYYPAVNGCPAYTTYTIKDCTCSYGYSTTYCPSGQTETLEDGTVCYRCEESASGCEEEITKKFNRLVSDRIDSGWKTFTEVVVPGSGCTYTATLKMTCIDDYGELYINGEKESTLGFCGNDTSMCPASSLRAKCGKIAYTVYSGDKIKIKSYGDVSPHEGLTAFVGTLTLTPQ